MRVEHRHSSLPPYLVVESNDAVSDLAEYLQDRYSYAAIEFEEYDMRISATQEHTITGEK